MVVLQKLSDAKIELELSLKEIRKNAESICHICPFCAGPFAHFVRVHLPILCGSICPFCAGPFAHFVRHCQDVSGLPNPILS